MLTLGILGGGQLGRMTALAALRLGVRVKILTDTASGLEEAFGDVTVGDWNDPAVLQAWAEGCDAVTVESEWAPADVLALACPTLLVWPRPETLVAVRHKGRQRERLRAAGLPGPAFALCPTREALGEAARALGLPLVAKRYEGSYDGYGNAVCRTAEDLDEAWRGLAGEDGLLAEAFVPFERELAVIIARGQDGAHEAYPAVHTEQRDGRCHAVEAPAGLDVETEAEAVRVALGAVEAIGAVGVCAAELFLLPEGTEGPEGGRILINELAPRPHNTGHHTLDTSHTSQFENHVRAVLGLPLGAAGLRVPAACMVNVLGSRSGPSGPEGLTEALAVPGASVHLYGKAEARPRRKMGHVTVTAGTAAEARALAERAAALLRL